jgi:phospholipid/cholesterol/gamma-HCH transport system substrate-binding protein
MKISNETKVGALTAIAITLLILGFNFLKGKTLFKTGNYIIAKYTDTKGTHGIQCCLHQWFPGWLGERY